jgi:hypothetical protein
MSKLIPSILASLATIGLLATAGSARATSLDAATDSLVDAPNIEIREGAVANQVAVFTVSLRYDGSVSPQTVDYRVLPGTATAGQDYVAIPDGTLVFMPGETTKTIEVPIIDDDAPECSEGFTLELQHWFYGAPMLVRAVILDDDGLDGGDGACPPAFPTASQDPGVDAGAAQPSGDGVDAAATTSSGEPRSSGSSSGCSIARTGSLHSWLLLGLALLAGRRWRRLMR